MAPTLKPRNLMLNAGALFLFLLLGLSVGSCVDGPSAMGLPQPGTVAQLSLAADFSAALAEEGAAPINRIRVTATVVGTGQVVGQEVFDVNSADPNWTVEIKVDIPTIPNPQVVLTVELINVTAGVETVEWSGQTEAIALSATTTATTAEVSVVRGPVENLAVTDIAIIAPENLRVGKSAALDATVATSASGGTPQVYWTSLTPEIGTVSASGVFHALAAGTAQVQATAGAATDVVSIQVLPAIYKVVVEPTPARANALGEELTFLAWVLDTDENPIDGEAVTWTVDDAGVLENLGGGGFRSVGEGTAQITATSVSEPSLSGTATVEVEQIPVRVDVTPAADTLEAVGETSQFSAEAFDENDNPISSATFAWGSDNPAVVTVDPTGLATAQGGGETEIWAEVMDAAAGAGTEAQGVEGGLGIYGKATIVVDLPLTLSLAPTDAVLPSIGATVQMIATGTDGSGNKVTGLTYAWTSSDPGVATVDADGLVTAVKDGQTTITVTADGMSATAVVTVKQEVAAVQWVQQPTDGESYVAWDPPPSVEVVDANGHRVEGFEGEASLEASYIGCCLSPTNQTARTPGPQTTVHAPKVEFLLGLAVFTGAYMVDAYGYFQLTATVIGPLHTFYALSVIFYMAYGY